MIPEIDKKKLKNRAKKTHSEYWEMIWLGFTRSNGASNDNGIHHYEGVGFKYFSIFKAGLVPLQIRSGLFHHSP